MSTVSENIRKSTVDYDSDYHGWLISQAAALRAGRFDALDIANLVEELESMARRDRAALKSQLRRLLVHLLKYRYQPERRSRSWTTTIIDARIEIDDAIEGSATLENELPALFIKAYGQARRVAAKQTGLDVATFPAVCEWTLAQVRDAEWLPELGKE